MEGRKKDELMGKARGRKSVKEELGREGGSKRRGNGIATPTSFL